MQQDTGIIKGIEIDGSGGISARIEGSKNLSPTAGRYLLAYNPEEPDTAGPQILFPVGFTGGLAGSATPLLGPVPSSWVPGTNLHLSGPYGNGFQLPQNLRRLALAAFGGSSSRLLPLILTALKSGVDITLFSDAASIQGFPLPAAVEINPISALPENLAWANLLVIDLPLRTLPELRQRLGLGPHDPSPCQVQVLVTTPMPCGGMADCGACAVPTRRKGFKLGCKDGPVFDLNELDW